MFSTNEAIVNAYDIIAPLGKSDHICMNIELNVLPHGSLSIQNSIREKRAWGKMHNNDLLDLSKETDWSYSSNELSIDDMWGELHQKLGSISENVPLVRAKNMPWAKGPLKRARKAKDKAWAVFDSKPTAENMNLALGKQGMFDDLSLKSQIKYEKTVTSCLKQNCKPFYAYLRSKRILKSRISSLSKPDGSMTKNDSETAELLADAFSSVYVKEPEGPLTEECYAKNLPIPILDLKIDIKDVQFELSMLDMGKAMGPDNIHPKLLKFLSDSVDFVTAVWKLFDKCTVTSSIPSQWKTASVTALFKKGSKKDPLNYRPVSLTCIISKVYEKFVRRHILEHVETKIHTSQHGFVERKSCLSNLLESVDLVLELLEEGAPVDIFYFDFRKAFDSVPHYRLLTKLESFGITGNTLKIIQDFLTGRSFQTSIMGTLSEIRKVLSGIPQGTVLGPVLFVLFINDLPDSVNALTKLFADDLKAFVDARNRTSTQTMLSDLEIWEDRWMLKFNPTKCKVLHLQLNNNPENVYQFHDVALDCIDTERDLGVVVNKSLTWDSQISACISKANQMVAWVTRNTVLRDKFTMRSIYRTIIRPNLEYCAQLWSPAAKHGNWSDIINLENVQRRFTRLVEGIGTLPYSERLEEMKLTTLAERRIRGDLIETFKILNSLVEYGDSLFRTGRSGEKLLRTNSKSSDKAIIKLHDSFLPNRVLQYWNILPSSVRNSSSVDQFKCNLEHFKASNINIFDTGQYWEVSNIVLEKIEGPSYLENKKKQIDFLKNNRRAASRMGVNIY